MRGYQAAQPKAFDPPPRNPVELYAVRRLADMAYRSRFQGFTELSGMAEANSDLDARSALKVRPAPLLNVESELVLLKHFESDPSPFIAECARHGGTSEFIAGY